MIICTIINIFIFNTFEYFIHELSHNPKIKILYNSHHKHHLIYPPNKLTVSNFDESENTSTPYLIIMMGSYIIMYQLLPLYYYLLFC